MGLLDKLRRILHSDPTLDNTTESFISLTHSSPGVDPNLVEDTTWKADHKSSLLKSISFPEPETELVTRSLNPKEHIPTPPGSLISYQDALALNYWDRRRSDYVVTACYINDATRESLTEALPRLLGLGLISEGDIRDKISLKTVPELKNVLRNANLKVSGNKSELIQRILDNFPESTLNALFPISKYHITEAGKKALEPYSIVLLANTYYYINISYYLLMQAKADNPDQSDEEIILNLMIDHATKLHKNGEVYLYRMHVGNIAQFLESMSRYWDAFNYYSIAFFISSISYQEYDPYSSASPDNYTASFIDKCARNSGLSFQQMVTSFCNIIRKVNPFGLGTESNLKKAVQALGDALSY